MIKRYLRKLKRLTSRRWRSLDAILSHPLAQKDRLGALWRYLSFHLLGRLTASPLVFPYVGDVKFFARPGQAGIVGNIYMGLEDFEEQAFLLHFLRPDDLFVDVGANVGAYSLLASGVCGAKSLAIEPIPETFEQLNRNIRLNGLETLITTRNIGIGSNNTQLTFTNSLDVLNRVVLPSDPVFDNLELTMIDVTTLDDLLSGQSPVMLKIDVEGYEQEVIQGAENVLHLSSLIAVIVELCGHESRYGFSSGYIHQQLLDQGFLSCSYSPFERRLSVMESFNRDKLNTIYLRNLTDVEKRIRNGSSVKVLDQII